MINFIGSHYTDLVLAAGALFAATLLWVSIDDAWHKTS